MGGLLRLGELVLGDDVRHDQFQRGVLRLRMPTGSPALFGADLNRDRADLFHRDSLRLCF
ncbi:MAG: hypothetical protein DI537_39025 [Stutzerimonas stutzeri]|nr:MAG: hypothetical protein DI537_39025 [Stutzerimonas stutzeri]